MYKVELRVILTLEYDDTSWVTEALDRCLEGEEELQIETIKEWRLTQDDKTTT